nr:23S rRNA (uracil(1939)-C(5))-methyltransferase RlmD [Parachlamydiaceae bacterium]
MSKQKPYRIVDIDITEYTAKGNGLGRCNNPNPEGDPWVLDVPFTMPGDRAQVKVLKKKAGVQHCALVQILSPSPDRIEARCIHFGICGGCRWQHLPYALQLKNKELYVQRCFGLLITPGVKFYPILPCEQAWEYRNKMEFSFSANIAGDKFLGLIMDSSRGKVLNLTECHLVHNWQIDTLRAVRAWWEDSTLEAYHPSKNQGSLRTLMLREGFRTGDRMVVLTVSGNHDYALHKGQIASFLESVKNAAGIDSGSGKLSIFLRIQQIAKGTATTFFEMHLEGPDTIKEVLYVKSHPDAIADELTFKISPAAFFQPNTLQAEQLYSKVLQLAEIEPNSIIYDLYCGTGTLGICLAKHAKQIIGIEISPEAVLDARANAALNGFTNVTIIDGSVGKVLGQPYKGEYLPKPDIVLVDPPRAGLEAAAIKQLLA